MGIFDRFRKKDGKFQPNFGQDKWTRRKLELDALSKDALLKNWKPNLSDFNGINESERLELISRSRDLYDNLSIGNASIRTYSDFVVGDGLVADVQVMAFKSDEENRRWEKILERGFHAWAKSLHSDARAKENFYSIQHDLMTSCLKDGDVFVAPFVKKRAGKFHFVVKPITADKIRTPYSMYGRDDIYHGVLVDGDYEHKKYYFTDISNSEYIGTNVFDNDGRRKVLALINSYDSQSIRGIPMLSPVMLELKQVEVMIEQEMRAGALQSHFSIFWKRSGLNNLSNDGIDLKQSGIYLVGKDDEFQFADPKRPTSNFGQLFENSLRMVSVGVGIPYEILLQHFASSYSASRASLAQFDIPVVKRRQQFNSCINQPVFDWWLKFYSAFEKTNSMQLDHIISNNLYRVNFYARPKISLDPQKQMQEFESRLRLGFNTIDELKKELKGASRKDL